MIQLWEKSKNKKRKYIINFKKIKIFPNLKNQFIIYDYYWEEITDGDLLKKLYENAKNNKVKVISYKFFSATKYDKKNKVIIYGNEENIHKFLYDFSNSCKGFIEEIVLKRK